MFRYGTFFGMQIYSHKVVVFGGLPESFYDEVQRIEVIARKYKWGHE